MFAERLGKYLKQGNRFIKLFISCFFGLLFFACTPKAETIEVVTVDMQVPVVQKPTETEIVIVQPTEVEPSLEPTHAPTSETTEEMVEEAVPEEPELTECIICHSDNQRLIDTAKPVEVVKSENEGEG